MRLRSLTFDELIARGVSRQFAGVLCDPDRYHPELNILVGKTNWDYIIPEGVTEIVPLWDANAESFVRWNRNNVTEFVWLFHDDSTWILIARSEQGIMAKLWQEWIEFQDSDVECRRFAEAIGFRFWETGQSLLDADYDAFTQWVVDLSDNMS